MRSSPLQPPPSLGQAFSKEARYSIHGEAGCQGQSRAGKENWGGVCAPQTGPCWERNLVLIHNPQAKLRLEMEMERMRQTHSKEMESRDEEVEEARQSCQKKVWHLSS